MECKTAILLPLPKRWYGARLRFHQYRYYLTSTTWTDVQITAASTIEGLKTEPAIVIWSDRSVPERACNFWAPEIHLVEDRWYVYFSASVCDSDWDVVLPTLRVYALAGGTDSPLSADYEMQGAITPPNFEDGMLDAVRAKSIIDFIVCRVLRALPSIDTLRRWLYDIFRGKGLFSMRNV